VIPGMDALAETVTPPATTGPVPGIEGHGHILEVRGLRTTVDTRRGTVAAVDGVDLSIHPGEVVALVGESGSGKSMTALSVMRLLPPAARVTAGSIKFDGKDLLKASEKEMEKIRGGRIAMLFQQPKASLDPTSQVGEQVGESYRIHRGASSKAAWQRAVDLLADVGIPEPERRAKAYPHQLSGGMAQRAMIAAALSGEPALLIADEPTTALDVTVQAQILRLLKAKQKAAGLSMLIITHDLGIVASVADRVVVMYAGRVMEEGPASRILTKPSHPYTEGLLRSSMLLPDDKGKLFAIRGTTPRPGEITCGCRFRTRCDACHANGLDDKCATSEPELGSGVGHGHWARCWMMGPDGECAMEGEGMA
jgi:peptide/nickel transport system ATP-binding protein